MALAALAVLLLAARRESLTEAPSAAISHGSPEKYAVSYFCTIEAQMAGSNKWALMGGGVLVAPKAVLTAAHVWLAMKAGLEKYRNYVTHSLPWEEGMLTAARVAIARRDRLNDFGVEFRAIKAVSLPSDPVHNDIAVLHLWTPSAKRAAILPSATAQPPARCKVIGFGKIDDIAFPQLLQGVEVDRVVPGCAEVSKKLGHRKPLLCYINLSALGMGTCAADSGGPLLVTGPKGDTVYGLVKGGYGPNSNQCGSKGTVSLFTDLRLYLSWINTEIAKYR